MKEEVLGLGKDSIIYGIGSVVTRFVGLITLPLFTAYLSPEEYGVLSMLALLTMVAQPLFCFGLSAAMGPSYYEKDNIVNKSQTVWSVFILNIIGASMMLILAWLFPLHIGRLISINEEYAYLVSFSLTGTALTVLVTAFMQRVQFEKQAKLYVAITVITALIAILVSIYAVVFMGWGVAGMVYGQVAGNLITFLAFLFVGIKSTVPSVNFQIMKELLKLGVPLTPSFAFVFIIMHSNKYILEWYHGLDVVGVYSIGFNLGMVMSVITMGIASAWYPFFMSYSNRQDDAKIIFGRILTYYFIMAGTLCAAFFIFAKPAVYILLNERFHDAYIVIGLVALSNVIQMLFNFFLPGIYYNKHLVYVSLFQGLGAVSLIAISYLIIEWLSMLGAAISIVLANTIMVIMVMMWNMLNIKKYLYIYYEWNRIVKVFIMLSVTIIIYESLPSVPLSLEILLSIMFFVLIIGGMYFLLNNNERDYIKLNLKRIYVS